MQLQKCYSTSDNTIDQLMLIITQSLEMGYFQMHKIYGKIHCACRKRIHYLYPMFNCLFTIYSFVL